jgi:hypothetical protein
MEESCVDALIVGAADMIGRGAPEGDVRAMLSREIQDEALMSLILTAARILVKNET